MVPAGSKVSAAAVAVMAQSTGPATTGETSG